MENTIKLTILGSGTPNVFSDREGPSVALQVNKMIYIFDAGRGISRRAFQANISYAKMTHLFLTHLHSDHTVGLPDYIFTTGVLGRTSPFHVFGPKGTQNMIDHIMAAYADDIRIRLTGLEPSAQESYEYHIEEIDAQWVYRDQYIEIRAFPVHHGNWDCFGFSINIHGFHIIISGDTKPCQTLIDYSKDCDILIHEVYSCKGFQEKSPTWQNYHTSMHTSAKELGIIASKVKPKQLVLYHQLYWNGADCDIIADIRENYMGTIISAKDLEQIDLRLK